jgi:hypothetical protein
VLPFQIKDTSKILHIIFAITLYSYYQYFLSWLYQSDEVQNKIKHEFIVVTAASFLAVSIYGWIVLGPLLRQIKITSSPEILSAIATVIATITSAFAVRSIGELKRRALQVFKIRQETIIARILTSGWTLIFNPKTRAQKVISFLPDGTIGEGRNLNEARWKISSDDELIISRSDGQLQNRFKYDRRTDQFKSIDDLHALGISGQIIFRSENSK